MRSVQGEGAPRCRNVLGVAAVVACGLATAATSPLATTYPRNYPAWKISGELGADQGSVHVHGWISKSGKEGIGLSLRVLDTGDQVARVAVKRTTLEVDGAGAYAGAVLAPVELAPGTSSDLYVPIAFDNEHLWNENQRSGRLLIELDIDGHPRSLSVALQHVLEGFHRAVRRDRPDAMGHPPQPPIEPEAGAESSR